MLDVAQRGARKLYGRGHIQDIGAHKHDIGTLDGDVGASSDGDAHVGARKRRGVVDTVADHGNASLCGKAADLALLILGEHAGNDLICADQTLDSLRRSFVVAREHNGTQAHGAQLLERGGA